MEPTIQRWSAKRKVELLLELIRGEKKLVDVCREHDLKQSEVEAWMDTFVKAGERGLKANGEDEAAAGALEDALRDRGIDSTTNLSLRSDNGLVFGAKGFVRVTRRYSVGQEYITPYSPEQNGMIERFFKTLKE